MWLDEYIWNPGTPMLCHRFHSWELYPTFLLAAGTTHWCMFMNYGWAWPFCKGRPMEHNGVYSSFFPGANYVYRGIWASLWKVEQIDNTFFFVACIGMLISWRSTLIFFCYTVPRSTTNSRLWHHVFFLCYRCMLAFATIRAFKATTLWPKGPLYAIRGISGLRPFWTLLSRWLAGPLEDYMWPHWSFAGCGTYECILHSSQFSLAILPVYQASWYS